MASVDSRSTEPISITVTANGVPVTGATMRYDVTRISGGVLQVLDRSDATFKAPASVVTRYSALAEVSAANAPGEYADASGGVNLPAITNATVPTAAAPLLYLVTYYETAPLVLTLATEEIRAGVEDNVRRQLTNREALAGSGAGTLYADDGVTVEATYTVTDKTGAAITLNPGDPARRTAQVTP